MLKTFLLTVLMLIFSQNIFPQGWQWVNTGYNFIMYDVSFPPGQSDIGYAVGSSVTYNGDGIILKTTDGGQSWFQISTGTIPGLEAVCFTSTEIGYAGGWQNYFIKTTDGGTTWNQINVNASIWYFNGIEFWDQNHGMTSTADPQIYITSDAGVTWTAATGLNQGVEDICYADANTAYVVGGDEKISRSTNGGLNWTEIYSGIFTRLFLGVSFYDSNYGIVSGEEGKVMVTTNGGATWTTSDAGGFGLMRSVWIFNPDSSYVVGTPEQIYKSTDGGLNWVEDFTSGYQEALYKIKFTENQTGIICGSQGKFLRNTDYASQQEPEAYTFNGGIFSYGTINLNTGAFSTLNFMPQGGSYYPATADNKEQDAQYTIMSDFSFPSHYYLWHVDFTTLTGDSIAPVGPLASGQNVIKGMAYNAVNNAWYVISANDIGTAAYLYTIDISSGLLTEVGQIQNADVPVSIAIDCDGNAYIVNIVFGISSTAVLNSLNLTTAVATAIGTDLGLADASGFSQDMDFDPSTGNLYWTGYWASGFFSEGGSFRLIDVATGTSTEIAAFGQFETLTGFNVIGVCDIVPVELQSFNASVDENTISLSWTTATETNNSGFEVERKSIYADWEKIGFIAGSGTTTEERSYSFRDNSIQSGSYSYRLKQIDYNGKFEYSDEIEIVVDQPMDYSLEQNYPNPFNPTTTIRFSLPEASIVKIKIFNALGEEVANLVNQVYEAGTNEFVFNASGLASGIYFLRMESGAFVSSKKITLLK